MKIINRVRLGHAGWLIALMSLAGTVTAGEKSVLASPSNALPAAHGVQVQNLYKHLAPQQNAVRGGVCGNSLLDAAESCDDGNTTSGDGCSATCVVEAGADCTLPTPPTSPVVNGSFEDGLPPWTTAFGAGGNPFLLADLTNPFGDVGQVGEFYILIFGSGGVADLSTIAQTAITIPVGATTLSYEFFGASQATDESCDGDNAVFRTKIDGTTIFDSGATPVSECDLTGPLWAFPQAHSIAAFADGGTHTLTFEREILAATPNNTNFFIDDVRIDAVVDPAVPSACFNGTCGDSILSSGEACDDGNTTGGDGCSATCTVEEDTHACGAGTTALECLTGGNCAAGTLATTNDVVDGGLEGGTPNDDWTEGGSCPGCVIEGFEPICSEAFCGTDRARNGAWFAWFGGIAFDPNAAGPNIGTLAQDVTISSSATDLSFDLDTQCSGDASDTLVVDIDGTTIGIIACTESLPGYTPQSFPIPVALADGGVHTLTLTGTNLCSEFVTDPTCQSNFFVDNIAIEHATPRPADPSACNALDPICVGGSGFSGIEKFEAGLPGTWPKFQLGTIQNGTNNWTTTDDTDYTDADGSGCGGVAANWPGGSTLSGASGEAACADADGSVEANGPDIEPDGTPDCGTLVVDDPASDCLQKAYLCTPVIDPFSITNGSLSFNVDYQTAFQDACDPDVTANCPHETLQLLVGTAPPNPFTIGGYESAGSIFDHKSVSLDISGERVLSLNLNAFIDPALTDPDPALTEPYHVCFHYAGVFSFYAQIDNVALRAEDCSAGDADFDGISDAVDNCTLVANADQRDTDGDLIGNACDADVDGGANCFVNFLDSQVYVAAFFGNGNVPTPNWNPDTDNNGDNFTNFPDLQVLSGQIFGPPGPSAAGCN